jgi:hypothetical protein
LTGALDTDDGVAGDDDLLGVVPGVREHAAMEPVRAALADVLDEANPAGGAIVMAELVG